MNRFLLIGLSVLVGLLVTASAVAQSGAESADTAATETPVLQYTFTDLGVLPGGDHALAEAINNDGVIVGGSGGSKPFIWEDGEMRRIEGFPGRHSYASAISNQGVVAVYVSDNFAATNGTTSLWHDGDVTELSTELGNRAIHVYDINDAGMAVGEQGQYAYEDRGLPVEVQGRRSYLWHGDQVTNLSDSESNFFHDAADINNHGVIAGRISDVRHRPRDDGTEYLSPMRRTEKAALYHYEADGIPEFLETPKGLCSMATGINDHGDVAGAIYRLRVRSGQVRRDRYRLAVWLAGEDGSVRRLITFNLLPETNSGYLADINDHRVAVGSCIRRPGTSRSRACVWTEATGLLDLTDCVVNLPEGCLLLGACGINDAGKIVGLAYTADRGGLGYLLTPIAPDLAVRTAQVE